MNQYALSSRNPGNIKLQDAQAVGDALDAIEREKGYIDNTLIVEASKRRGNILHRYVWDVDQETALDEYRKIRAGRVRRSVVTLVENPFTREIIQVPAHIVVSGNAKATTRKLDEHRTRFVTTQKVLADAELLEQEADRLLNYIYAYRNRLALHERFEALVDELDRLMAEAQNTELVAAAM